MRRIRPDADHIPTQVIDPIRVLPDAPKASAVASRIEGFFLSEFIPRLFLRMVLNSFTILSSLDVFISVSDR